MPFRKASLFEKLRRNKMNKAKTRKQCLLLLSIIISAFYLAALYGCGNAPDSGTTPTPTPGKGTLTLSLTSNTVTYGTPVTATATLKDGNGAITPNTVVTFAATSNLVVFTPASATTLTNASGVASVTLDAESISSSGATSITASASVTSGTTTATVTSAPVGIAVNGAAVTIQSLTLGSPSISSYGTSSVSALIWLNGAPATVPVSVAFTSSCGNKATLTTPVTTIAGTATSTYKDNNCAMGSDVITASVTGNSKSVTITVVPPEINNIQFISATPSIIGTKTASAPTLPKSSLIKFKVVDNNNNGRAGVLVNFSLLPASAPGGITLSPVQATSDINGEVTTAVTSGTVPTPVWVVARLSSNPSILTQSNTLTITTGLPTQDFFSLSVQTANIEGLNYDGVTSALTIIASDRLGNPLPDDTAINFITEGGQITPASCTTTAGTCTVIFKSAEFRPANGRVTVLAYAIGEKSFLDANSNNSYDTGETFYDIGDPYIDANENSVWDSGEFYISSTTSGSSACLTRPGGGALPTRYGNALSKENSCDATWGQNYVRRSAVIVLSGYAATITPTTVAMGASCRKTFDLMLMDVNSNPMPAGTQIAIRDNYVDYTPFGAAGSSKATVRIDTGSPVLNATAAGGTPFTLTVEADCSTGIPVAYPAGTVTLRVQSFPSGRTTSILITVNP